MGDWKLMLPFDGETVVERSVRNALGFCSRVILVVGFRGEEMSRLFSGRPEVKVVTNTEYSFGMFSSIQCGAREVTTDRFFISLADMPLIPASIYRSLAELPHATAGWAAARPFFHGSKGHPVLLSRAVIDKILQFNKSHTMQDVLQGLPLSRLETEEIGVVQDIDDPNDYRDLSRLR